MITHRPTHPLATAPPRGKVRIVIVEDHELVRYGLAQILAREPAWELCGEAGDPAGALRLIAETRPDLAIVDLRLNQGASKRSSGCRRARQSCGSRRLGCWNARDGSAGIPPGRWS